VFDAQPFGDPRKVAAIARDAARWADDLLKEVKGAQVDRDSAQKLLIGLQKEVTSRTFDFDSARQLAWAYRAIHDEIDPAWLKQSETEKAFKSLDDQLKLELPKGQVEIAKDFLREALDRLNNYEPERFRLSFKLLTKKTK
jgi:hypothetical protein